MLTCLRCGHIWRPRMDEPSARCPKCRSYYWDKPRPARKSKTPQGEKAPVE